MRYVILIYSKQRKTKVAFYFTLSYFTLPTEPDNSTWFKQTDR